MTKVVILGGRGYMGQKLLKVYPNAVCPSLDISDRYQVLQMIDAEKPDMVINAAGKTGRPNVDWCEAHKEETIASNVTGPLVLLDVLGERGIYWVHLSSGCIYEGDNDGRGFSEEDPPNFYGSFYSRTKLWSDQMLAEFPVLTLRVRMPFDGTTEDRNLIMKLKNYDRVLDVPNSITNVPDLMHVLEQLAKNKTTGVFNVVNEGVISPYGIMEMYQRIVDPSKRFERLTLDHLPDVVRTGRSNCILSADKLATVGLRMRGVEEALAESLTQLAQLK